MPIQKITPFLWFDDEAHDAAKFYVSLFKDSKITGVTHYGAAGPGKKGTVMSVTFKLAGQEFMALNGGPVFTFTPALSLFVNCKTQKEVDRLWEKLSKGGAVQQCGWLTDRYGVTWQIVPTVLGELLESKHADKVERVRSVARWLMEQWFNLGIPHAHVADADRAAELAKCDLATEMVREFPELQGIVGGLYARAQGEPDDVADAVYDHYRPVGLDDPIPRNLIGCGVALADKLDSIVGCFAVGILPTGSSDPYGLRRAALGVVKVILDKEVPLSLSLGIASASKALHAYAPKRTVTPAQESQVLEFILDRAKFVFREREGFSYDEVNAVFRAGADDLVDAQKRLLALRAIRKSKNFEPLTVSFKRIRRILEKAKIKDGATVNPELFESDAERELFAAGREAAGKVQAEKRAGHYEQALNRIAGLRKSVDRFFDEVMVMAEDEGVRKNRLALLSEQLREFTTIADFSEIGADELR